MRPRDKFIWYGLDLDGTLAYQIHDPDDWTTWYAIGPPIWDNVDKAFEVKRAGYKIVIHSARPWDMYELVENWLNKHAIPWDKIVLGKFNCHRFVDDKAVNASEDTWL